MVAQATVRQYAAGQAIGVDVADQEIVLTYVLALLNEAGLVGFPAAGGEAGPLLFKGGTALRKCVFGSTGRFSQDVDLDAAHKNGFEAQIEEAFRARTPYHGITFQIPTFRYSDDDNFSGTVHYEHEHNSGSFELQISYRLDPVLDARRLPLAEQGYFRRMEITPPDLYGLDPYEMIGEKIMACNRRVGGSAKDVYDLYLWSSRPFDAALVRRLAVLKAWTDQRRSPRYDPGNLLQVIEPANFRWTDIEGLVPRKLSADPEQICTTVRDRLAFLPDCSDDETALLADQSSHREHTLFGRLKEEAREIASTVTR